jgi:hypothetical protein
MRGSGIGFYTFLYRYLYGEGPVLLGRMEELRTELLALLARVGQPVSPDLREHIEHAARLNASQHAPYVTYYGEALRREVAERDAEVIVRHDYRFGD